MENLIAIPGFIHHCNLAVFPKSSKQDSHVYLYGTSGIVPTEADQKVQVEYLDSHIYCLLPSYQPTLGTVCYYQECPEFIKEFNFGIDIGAVHHPAAHHQMETEPNEGIVPGTYTTKNRKEVDLQPRNKEQREDKQEERKNEEDNYKEDNQ